MPPREITARTELHALLGEGACFAGKLTFEGRVRIDGTFEGEVMSDGVLILGEQARVDARMEVGTLIVLGATVRGEIHAAQGVELHAPARVYADIHTPQLMVDKGVLFEGKSHAIDASGEPAASAQPEP